MTGSAAEKPTSMKWALHEVFDHFGRIVTERPSSMLLGKNQLLAQLLGFDVTRDTFGSLAINAFNLFLDTYEAHAAELGIDLNDKSEGNLNDRFAVSQLGIGTIAVFLELVPLVYMRDRPRAELSSTETAEIAANSYDFIDLIIASGSRVGAAISRDYIKPVDQPNGGWSFRGTIVDGELHNPERLRRFELVGEDDALKVVPIGIEPALEHWQLFVNSQKNPVNCPAYIHTVPETGISYARRLFDIMLEHTREHLYPDFIPHAREIIEYSQV